MKTIAEILTRRYPESVLKDMLAELSPLGVVTNLTEDCLKDLKNMQRFKRLDEGDLTMADLKSELSKLFPAITFTSPTGKTNLFNTKNLGVPVGNNRTLILFTHDGSESRSGEMLESLGLKDSFEVVCTSKESEGLALLVARKNSNTKLPRAEMHVQLNADNTINTFEGFSPTKEGFLSAFAMYVGL